MSNETQPFKEFTRNEFTAGQSFRQLEGHPDKVIRVYSEYVKSPDIAKAMRAKELFTDLSARYGIHIPSIEYVIGKDESGRREVLYTVTDKIDGKNLGDLVCGEMSQDEYEKVEDFFVSLIHYYQDIYQNGGDYLADIGSQDQYVYGHAARQNEDNIYLVDLDPYFLHFSIENPGATDNRRLFYGVGRLRRMVISPGKIKGIQFERAAAELDRFLSRIPETTPHYELVANPLS